jgi:hypothetical protein
MNKDNKNENIDNTDKKLHIPVVMCSILVKLIEDVYFKGYGDGYSVMYNEEFVGQDKTMLKEVDGVDKVIEDMIKKYCT